MNIFLILGCNGRKWEGFCFCKGILNNILELGKPSNRNNEIIDFLDERYNLFDRPLCGNVHTAIYNLQDKFSKLKDPVFIDTYFKHMEEFCIQHKKCGLYLRLGLLEKGE